MLSGPSVTLRGLELDDVPTIVQHFNNIKLRQFLSFSIPVSKEDEEKWVRSTWEGRRQGHHYEFGIELNETKQLVGTTGLMKVDAINRIAELGIAVWQPKYWGQGLGTEAMTLLLDFGFCFLNLFSIYLFYMERNTRARRSYEKLGFLTAGKLRKARFFDNQREDMIFMDLLAEEWKGPRLLKIPKE